MQDRDLRDWIKQLEENGELARVATEVDWRDELAAVTRKSLTAHGPALLFENIKDYQDGWCRRLFVNGIGSARHISLAFGEGKDTQRRVLVEKYRKAINNPLPSVVVPTGTVHENVKTGDQINLWDIPVPHWHPLDGGRYINTWCGVVTKDPDTELHNVGMYRGMVSDKDKISVLMVTSQNWGHHYYKWMRQGKECPVAVVYGYDDLLFINAGSQIPPYVSEYDVTGAIRGYPVPLVKCKTQDLLVPANAEMVVEGVVRYSEDAPEEGPFGEYTGYYGAERRVRPYIQVTAITHRNNAIFRGNLEGAGPQEPNEDSHLYAVTTKALMQDVLHKAGVPGVIDVRPGPVNFVKIRQQYQGHAKHVANALWGSYAAEWMWKVVVVVDHDIDIYNERQTQWAICYRTNPGPDDLIIMNDTRGGTLDPSTPGKARNEMAWGTGRWNRLLIDATRPLDEATRNPKTGDWEWWPLSTVTHEGVMEKVDANWSSYGIQVPEQKKKKG